MLLQYVLALLFNLSCCCRQAKAELRTATAKVDEMTKLLQNVQDQMQRRVREKKMHPIKIILQKNNGFPSPGSGEGRELVFYGCSAPILSLFVIVLDT